MGDTMYSVGNNTNTIPCDKLNEIYKKMPLLRQQRVDKIKIDVDRANSIVAWDMIEKLMAKNGINAYDYDYAVDDNGKPYLVDCPLYFSISHSKNVVAVSVCDTEVGVDVQHIVDDYDKIAKKVCTKNELEQIKTKRDFLRVWTHKEATVKCTGAGIADMTRYDFSKEYDSQFRYTFYEFDDYCLVECKKEGD